MRKSLCLVALILTLPTAPLHAQGYLENPQPGSFQSGIGVISGWACKATRIDIVIDQAATFEAAYGTSREDTRSVCGDANNGFGLLINWNLFGSGTHTVRVLADGAQFGSATFAVTTLGAEFLSGKSGTFVLNDFPMAGQSITIQWQEASQNFIVTGMSSTPSSVPNVAGTWLLTASFLSNTCWFITVPGDLPTTLAATLFVSQQGPSLSVLQGSSILTGAVEPDGDFTLFTEPAISFPIAGCTEVIVIGEAGNFLTGQAVVVESAGFSGDCLIFESCAITWAGSIRKTSSTTSDLSSEEGEDAGAIKELESAVEEAVATQLKVLQGLEK